MEAGSPDGSWREALALFFTDLLIFCSGFLFRVSPRVNPRRTSVSSCQSSCCWKADEGRK